MLAEIPFRIFRKQFRQDDHTNKLFRSEETRERELQQPLPEWWRKECASGQASGKHSAYRREKDKNGRTFTQFGVAALKRKNDDNNRNYSGQESAYPQTQASH